MSAPRLVDVEPEARDTFDTGCELMLEGAKRYSDVEAEHQADEIAKSRQQAFEMLETQ